MMRIERCLVDANWGSSTDVVYQFCRQSAHAGIVMPSHGRFVGASSQPFSEYKRRPGDRIGYLAKNTDVYYEMLFGAAKVRAVMNGVNTRLAAPEVKFILSDAKATVLFVGKDFYAMIDTIKAELPDLKRIITIDGDREDWDFYPSWRNSKSAADPGIKAEGDDDVIQLYTSGTTGLPKGVQLTNDNYLSFFSQAKLLEWSSYDAGDAVMNAMPLFHVAGVNAGVLGVAQGAKTVILREIDPQLILKLIGEHRIAHAFWVPAVILMLTQQPNIKEIDFSSLKQVFYGASPISSRKTMARLKSAA